MKYFICDPSNVGFSFRLFYHKFECHQSLNGASWAEEDENEEQEDNEEALLTAKNYYQAHFGQILSLKQVHSNKDASKRRMFKKIVLNCFKLF